MDYVASSESYTAKLFWVAISKDGSQLRQRDGHNSEAIDRRNLRTMVLVDADNNPILTQHFKSGQQLIYRSRTAMQAATDLKHQALTSLLATHKTGAQSIKARAIIELINAQLDLRTCSREDLIKVWGIGLKSASCFILHSRPNIRIAGIDTHMLKFLRQHGIEVAKVTKRNYLDLEIRFLQIADDLNMTPAECDLWVWNSFKVKRETPI